MQQLNNGSELYLYKKTGSDPQKQIENFLRSRDLKNLNDKELDYITKQLLVDLMKDELKTETENNII